MPWRIVSDHSECPASKPYGVVQDDNGDLMGCHQTEEAAQDQMAALYANEGGKTMTRQTKQYPASFKAVETEGTDEGVFEAIVSVFGNVDLVGEKVLPGAFTKSLQKWSQSADPIPVIWSHQWDDLDAHVGEVLEAEERDEGLYIKGRLDTDDDFARKLYNKMKRRRVKEFSFAYDVIDSRDAKDGVTELVELDVIEVGPTLKGANPDTQLLAVKNDSASTAVTLNINGALDPKSAAEEIQRILKSNGERNGKAGRTLSTKNENKLRDAQNLIAEVLSSVASGDGEEGKAEEPDGAKADDRLSLEAVRLQADLLEIEKPA